MNAAGESNDLLLALPRDARLLKVPPILTVKRTAKLLGVNVESVRRLIRRGTIPARKIPGIRQRYIVFSELLAQMRPTRAGQEVL